MFHAAPPQFEMSASFIELLGSGVFVFEHGLPVVTRGVPGLEGC